MPKKLSCKPGLNLERDEHFPSVYDGAPAHHNPGIPGHNTKLKKLLPYSPFLNIVQQAISTLKSAIKADISRPEIQEQMNNREEARRLEIALGNDRTQLLLSYNEISLPLSPVYTTIFRHGTRLNLAPVPNIFGPAPFIFDV